MLTQLSSGRGLQMSTGRVNVVLITLRVGAGATHDRS